MTTYFRVQPGNYDPHRLLDPACQTSTAWHNPAIVMDGVSACASREELATYLATAGQGIPYGSGGWVLVEMGGEELPTPAPDAERSEEHTSELQSRENLVCRLLLEDKRRDDHPVQKTARDYKT